MHDVKTKYIIIIIATSFDNSKDTVTKTPAICQMLHNDNNNNN